MSKGRYTQIKIAKELPWNRGDLAQKKIIRVKSYNDYQEKSFTRPPAVYGNKSREQIIDELLK